MNTLSHILAILTAEQPLVSYHGKELLFFPEFLTVLVLAWVIFSKQLGKIVETWLELPRAIRLGTVLIFLGGIVGTLLASNLTTSLGALKSWFLFPILGFLLVVSFPKLWSYVCYGLISLASIEVAFAVLDALSHHTLGRLQGSFQSANFLAMLLVPAIVLTSIEVRQHQKKWFWILLTIFLVLGLLGTRSVGGVLSLVLVGLVLLFRMPLSGVQRSGLITLLVLGLLFAGVIIHGRLKHGQANSITSRLQIWRTAIVLGSEQPLTGIGIGNFPQRYQSTVVSVIGGPPVEWGITLPHEIFLAFWLYTGVLGLAGLFCLLAESLKASYGYALLPFLALFGHGLVDTPYFLSQAVYIFWLVLALGLVAFLQERKSRRTESS